MARELTLVLDRSGSLRGAPFEQVRAGAEQMLAGLEPDDRFNLVAYHEAVDRLSDRALPATRANLNRAQQWLHSLHARGGTNIYDALLEALRPEPSPGALPMVVFLTDGLPTIGRTTEAAITELVAAGNPVSRRLFTVGIGVDVNTPLLDRLASETRGFASFVLPGEDVELKLARVFRALTGPQISEPRLWAGDRVRELLPQALPDLYAGQQLVVLGHYLGEAPIEMELEGVHDGAKRTFRFRFSLDSASTRNAFVPRLWARRRVAWLVEQLRRAGADGATVPEAMVNELGDEIVRLSTEFGILTEYTAFLAEEGTPLDAAQVKAQARQNLSERALATRSGAESVNQELNLARQKKQKALNPRNDYVDKDLKHVEVANVQQVADRALFRRDGRWVDGRLLSSKVTSTDAPRVIRRGTAEFRQLLERLARNGRQGMLALEGDILLLADGQPTLVTSR